jgi:hypothetical protein
MKNEAWRKARLYEGDNCLLLKWDEGKVRMGIVYMTETDKAMCLIDGSPVKLYKLTKVQREAYDDALDYLISIAHDRPYDTLLN